MQCKAYKASAPGASRQLQRQESLPRKPLLTKAVPVVRLITFGKLFFLATASSVGGTDLALFALEYDNLSRTAL